MSTSSPATAATPATTDATASGSGAAGVVSLPPLPHSLCLTAFTEPLGVKLPQDEEHAFDDGADDSGARGMAAAAAERDDHRYASALAAAAEAEERDEHTESCIVCGGIGELLLCDTCPLVFHLHCARLRSVPEGLWSCDVCTGRSTLNDYRLRRMQAREKARQARERSRQSARETHARPRRMTRSGAGMEDGEDVDDGSGSPRSVHPLLEDRRVECAFCHRPDINIAAGAQPLPNWDPEHVAERMLGPFREERNSGRPVDIYVHRACATWSPQVFVQSGKLQNVVLEVQRARWLSCSQCGKRGASIGCFDPSCHRSFHYACALGPAQACMLLPSYKLLCPNHAIERNFRAVLRMPEPLLQQRIANVKQQCALRESHSSAAAIANSAQVGEEAFYSAASLYDAYLQRWKASQAARGAPFAHLAHLPEHERRRRRKIEQNILSQAEIEEQQRAEQQQQQKRKEKRRRDQLTEEEQQREDQEAAATKRQKQKEADDAQALAEMNAVGDAVASSDVASAALPNASPPSDPWRDVGGLSAQIDSIKECVLLPLLYGELFAQRHISAPKGIVLVGPPGSGKSLLARSLARACSAMVQPTSSGGRPVSFFARKGADVLSKFHGDAEQTLRSLFDKAERCAPSIIYFDEIDGLAPVRSAKQNQVHSSVVTTLLSLMDGLTARTGVFVLASTNRIDALDPALRRPGRFDREVRVGLPAAQQRKEILAIHTRAWPQASHINDEALQSIAARTGGFSGADLRALCAEAALNAAHRTLGPSLLPRESVSSSLNPRRDPAVLARLELVRIEPRDFDAALASSGGRVGASAHRHDSNSLEQFAAEAGQSEAMMALLRSKLYEATEALDLPRAAASPEPTSGAEVWQPDVVPMEDAAVSADVSSATSLHELLPLTLPTTLHRVLICDTGPPPPSRMAADASGATVQVPWQPSCTPTNSSLLAAALLARGLDIEGCVVRRLDIPSLLLDPEALTLEEACVRTFQAAASCTANVFFLPRFDEWWQQTSIQHLQPLRAALISCLRNLAASCASSTASASSCNIVVATSSCSASHFAQSEMSVHPFLRDFFRSNFTVSCHAPSKVAILAFFMSLLKQSVATLANFVGEVVATKSTAVQAVMKLEASATTSVPPLPASSAAGESVADVSISTAQISPDGVVAKPASIPSGSDSSSVQTAVSDWMASQLRAAMESLTTACLKAKLDFLGMQRVELSVQRWLAEQMELCRQTALHPTSSASSLALDHRLAALLRGDQSQQWHSQPLAVRLSDVCDAACAAVVAACEGAVEEAAAAANLRESTAPRRAPAEVGAPPEHEWLTIAQRHAQANKGRPQLQAHARA